MSVTVAKIHNPFQRSINDLRVLDHIPGLPLSHYVGTLPAGPDITPVVAVNGRVVDTPLDQVLVGDGDRVAVTAKTDATVASAVAAWVTGYASFSAAAAAGFGAAVAYGATFLVTSFALAYGMSALVSALGPDAGASGDTQVNDVYGWGELQQTSTEGLAIPYIFGVCKVAGNIINQFITVDGNKETFNALIGLADHEVDAVWDVRLNDQPYTYYKDVSVVTTELGTLSDSVIPGFDYIISQVDVGSKLEYNSPVTQQTDGTAVEKVIVIVTAPNGLYYSDDDGSLGTRSAGFDIHIRAVGESAWTLFSNATMTGATTETQREVYEIDGLPADQYEIKVTRTNEAESSYRGNTDIYLTAIQEGVMEALTYPGLAKLGITALATDQLSGGVPTISCLVGRDTVSVYNEDAGTWDTVRSTNPAWITYSLLHDYAGISESRMIWGDFKAWADYCDEDVDGDFRFIVSAQIQSSNFWSEIQRVAALGRAAIIRRGTRYGVFCDKPETVVSHMFNMGNIIDGTFTMQYLPKKDRANCVEIEYTDPDRDHTRQVVTVYSDDYLDDETESQAARVSIGAAISQAQATREGVFRINSNKYLTRVVKFDAFIDSFACVVGDLFFFQHESVDYSNGIAGSRIVAADAQSVTLDREVTIEVGVAYKVMVRMADDTLEEKTVTNSPGTTDILTVDSAWSSIPAKYDPYLFGVAISYKKPYRLTSITFADDFVRTITGVEYVDAVYTANDSHIIEEPVWNTIRQAAVSVQLSEFLTYSNDGGYQSNVRVSWYRAYSEASAAWGIWLEDLTAGTAPAKVAESTSNTHAIIANSMVTGHEYRVYVAVLGEGPVDTGSNTATITIMGQQAPPDDVANFYAEWDPLHRVVNMVWDHVGNIDFNRYEIRAGAVWETAETVGSTSDNACSVPIEEGVNETRTYLIKAFDKTENESVNPASYDVAINTSATGLSVPTGLTITSSSNIGSDGTDTVMMLLSWDNNAEVSDHWYQYAVRVEDKTTGKVNLYYTQNTEHQIPVLPNHDYGGAVASIDKSGNQTAWSSEVLHTTTKDAQPPSDPTSLTATGTFTQILLSWSHGAEADLDHFVIYRSVTNNFGTAYQVGSGVREFSGELGMFPDTPPTSGTYYYWVSAVDSSGNESDPSGVASASAPGVEIADGSITETKIADNSISTPKLAANSVVASKISAGAVGTDHLAANSVVASKISVSTLSAISADIGTVTAGRVQNSANTTYLDLTNNLFSLGGLLTWNGSSLSINGSSTIAGTSATTVVNNASAGATFTGLDAGDLAYLDQVTSTEVTSITGNQVQTGVISGGGSTFNLNTGYIYVTGLSGNASISLGSTYGGVGGYGGNVFMRSNTASQIVELYSNATKRFVISDGQLLPGGSSPDQVYIGNTSYPFRYIVAAEMYTTGQGWFDVIDDLDALHAMKPKRNNSKTDLLSLPRKITNYYELREEVRAEMGDMIVDADFDELLQDDDELGYRLMRNVAKSDAFAEGSIRQLDIETQQMFQQVFEWLGDIDRRLSTMKAA